MILKRHTHFFVKIISRIGLVLVAIFASLFILEAIIRLSPWEPDNKQDRRWGFISGPNQSFYSLDPKRIYKISPDVDQYPYGSIVWQSDENGFRENDSHRLDNRKDYKKIVFVGDSFTYGHGLSNDESLPYLLEQKLNSSGYNVWVDNAGVPGYGLDQEYVYLKDEIVPQIKPDIIIWGINFNDFGDSSDACLFNKIGNRYYQLSGRLNSLYFRNYYYPQLPEYIKTSLLFLLLDSKIPERYTLGCSRKELDVKEMANKMEYFFNEIKHLTRNSNTNFVVAIVLNQYFFVNKPGDHDWQNSVAWNHRLRSLIAKAANNAGVSILDTNALITYSPVFNEQVLGYNNSSSPNYINLFLEEENFHIGGRHPSKEGSELMSKIIYDGLKSWLLTP